MADPAKFVFSGRHAGGAFGIVGEGFGSSGSLTISGRPVPTTLWTDKDIRGMLPADLKPGEVIVHGATVQKGVWPQPHPPAVTVTTTTSVAPAAPTLAAAPGATTAPTTPRT